MNIIGTGLSGLVGTRIQELLSPSYSFTNFSRSTGVDIVDEKEVLTALEKSDASVVLHVAAKSDVDGCELDRKKGKDGESWKVNVIGTQNIVYAAKKTGKKVIFISTDFIFDGEKDVYTEEDTAHPINWYGQTKYEAEQIVKNSGIPYIIVRIAFPYRAAYTEKKDFMRIIRDLLVAGKKIQAVEDQIFSPTFIDDIAHALETLIKTDAEGIFHVVGSQQLSPYDAAVVIANAFECDASLVQATTREVYFVNRARRPYRLALKNDKIAQLGVKMRSFEEGIGEVKKQISNS